MDPLSSGYVIPQQVFASLHRANAKKIENNLPDSSKKINDIGFDHLKYNNLEKKPTSAWGSWFVGKIGGTIATFGSGLTKKKQNNHIKLETLSDGPEFGQILSAIAHHPQTMLWIKDAIGGFFGDAAANCGSLPTVIEDFLVQTVVNMAQEMRAGDAQVAITPANVISFLFTKINKDLNAINSKLLAIRDSQKEKNLTDLELNALLEREKKEMIQSLRDHLINMLFPHGINDVPLNPISRLVYGLRGYLWNLVKGKVEKLLYNLDDLRKLKQLSPPDESESMNKDSRRLAQSCVHISRAYLTSDSESVVRSIIGNSPVVTEMNGFAQSQLVEYFSAQIQEFGQSKNRGIQDAWELLESTLESFMTLIVTNLSKDKKPDETTSVMLVSKILKTLSRFVKSHGNEIDRNIKTLENYKKHPAQIKNDPSYIDKFRPLAQSYREMSGLTELPELLKKVFDTLFINKIPQLFAQNYEEMILPLVELFDAVDGSKLSFSLPAEGRNNDGLSILCDLLGKSVANQAPSWIEGQSKNIADKIALSVPKASDEIREWVSEWLNGKLIELVNRKNEKLWNFVESTIPNVLAHIIVSLSKGNKDRENLLFNSLNTILARLNNFAKSNGKMLADAKNDRAELIAIFKPFCESLMKEFGIGNGKKLPVPELLNATAEEQLKKILPELCAQYYLDFYSMSERVATMDQLRQNEANEGLAKLTQVASQLVSKWTPEILEENSGNIIDNIVEAMFPLATTISSEDHQKRQILKQWLIDQFTVIGPNLSKEYPEIWSLLGRCTEAFLSHIFYNISKGNVASSEGAFYGTTQVLDVLQSFIEKNQLHIVEKCAELKKKNVQDPFSHQEIIQLFVPLAESIQKLIGLSEFSGVFNQLLETIFTKYAPILLAKLYTQSLLPLNDLYQAINKPKSLDQRKELEKYPGGARLASWCKIAGKYVGEEIPKVCEDPLECKELANKIALMLVTAMATPEQKEILEKQARSHLPLKVPEELLDLHQWACIWFENKIKAAANSEDPELKKFWDFAKYSVDDLLAYIALNLIGENEQGNDVLFVIINKVLDSYIEFNNIHENKIKQAYLDLKLKNRELPEDKQDPAKNKQFVALFLPLFQAIMQKAGIQKGQHLPIPKLLAAFGEEQLEKIGPQLFADLYSRLISAGEGSNDHAKSLERIQQVVNSQHLPEDTPQGGAVKAIKSLSALCAAQLVKMIREINISKKDQHAKGPLQTRLDEAIPHLNHPQMQRLWNGLENSISSIILQLFANHLESMSAAKQPIDYSQVSEVVTKLLVSLFAYSPQEEAAIDFALKMPSPAQRKKALKELFAERIDALLSIFKPVPGQNQFSPLSFPLPPAITELLWNQLETSILPEFLASIYSEKAKGQKQAEIEAAEMVRITGSNTSLEVCETLANYVSKWLPTLFKLDHQIIAEDIYEVVFKKLNASKENSDAQEVEKYLLQNKGSLIKETGETLSKAAPALDKIQPLIKESIKTSLLQFFSKITKRIDSFENPQGEHYEKDFFLKLAISLMKLTKEHLQTLNTIAVNHKSKVFHQMDQESLLKGLIESKTLHPGVPQTPEAQKAQAEIKKSLASLKSIRSRMESLQKFGFLTANSIQRLKDQKRELRHSIHRAQKILDKERLTHFFHPLTKNLLELSGLSADALPFPSPVKDILWDQLQKEILPTALMGIFQNILDPYSLNRMIIIALDNYNHRTEMPERACPKDSIQQELDTLCGELFLQMVKILSDSFGKKALNFDKIKNMSAEKMGECIRIQLTEMWTLKKAIDVNLPSLDNSLKNKKIPADDDAFEVEALKAMHLEEATLRTVKTDMKNTAHKVISESISASISRIRNKFTAPWNKLFKKVCGKHIGSVKKFFNFIGFRAVHSFVKGALFVASLPLILLGWIGKKIFWALMDSYIAREVDHVLNSVHMPSIHEDLLYKFTERLVRSLRF